MCDRWREDFTEFYADMGDRAVGQSLERIDNSDPSALVGLPLIETARMLRAAGIPILGRV